MAGSLSLSNLLCFLANKYGKLKSNDFKVVLSEFYSIEDIAEAKFLLLDDVKNAADTSTFEKLPHMARRRDSVNRLGKEVDDLFSLWVFVDENGLSNSLPTYVSDSPDRMPSLRLFEGDMLLLLNRLEKVEHTLNEHGSVLATISTHVSHKQSTHTPFSMQVRPATQAAQASVSNQTSHAIATTPLHQAPSVSFSWALGGSESTSTPTGQSGQSGTTTVDVHSDQYAGCSESNDELPFTVVESARSRRKRRRQQISPPQQQQQQHRQQQPQTNDKKDGNIKRPGRSLIVGKSIAATNGKPLSKEIKAANEFYKKAVFYIDNVDPSVTAEDLEEFVTTNLSVQVFSVFDAKPRKYKNNNTNKSKKNTEIVAGNAFRLCINNEHRDRLLNEDCWPAYVKVAEWVFKPAKQQNKQSSDVQLESSAAPIPTDDNTLTGGDSDVMTADDTIIMMTDHSQSLSNSNLDDDQN